MSETRPRGDNRPTAIRTTTPLPSADIAHACSRGGDEKYGDLLFWSDATRRSVNGGSAGRGDSGPGIERATGEGGRDRKRHGRRDAVRFPARPAAQKHIRGYRVADGLDPVATTCSPRKPGSRASWGLPRATSDGIGSGSRACDRDQARRRTDLMVRLDVQYLMPSLVMQAPTGSLLEQTTG